MQRWTTQISKSGDQNSAFILRYFFSRFEIGSINFLTQKNSISEPSQVLAHHIELHSTVSYPPKAFIFYTNQKNFTTFTVKAIHTSKWPISIWITPSMETQSRRQASFLPQDIALRRPWRKTLSWTTMLHSRPLQLVDEANPSSMPYPTSCHWYPNQISCTALNTQILKFRHHFLGVE